MLGVQTTGKGEFKGRCHRRLGSTREHLCMWCVSKPPPPSHEGCLFTAEYASEVVDEGSPESAGPSVDGEESEAEAVPFARCLRLTFFHSSASASCAAWWWSLQACCTCVLYVGAVETGSMRASSPSRLTVERSPRRNPHLKKNPLGSRIAPWLIWAWNWDTWLSIRSCRNVLMLAQASTLNDASSW